MKGEAGGRVVMALIACPECGKGISTSAVACPNCGKPVDEGVRKPATPEKKSKMLQWIILATVGVLALRCGLPAIVVGVSYSNMKYRHNVKVSMAKLQLVQITSALEQYHIEHDEYPESLLVLTAEKDPHGTGFYLEVSDLRTPWGDAYQYDPSGPKNGGAKPDVWAESPQGKIGNWMK